MPAARRLALLVAALAAVGVAVTESAGAADQPARRAGVRAVFSFVRGPQQGQYRDLHIRITRRGRTLVDGPARVPGCAPPFCAPGGGLQGRSVRVRDLDGDGEPEVVLDLFTGGAHCCVKTRVYWFDGAGYRSVVHDFADIGYRLRDLGRGRTPELVSADPRFAFLFTSFAASVFPLQVWAFRDQRLVDVTRLFPARVQADAARAFRLYRRARRSGALEPRGAIAAWAADQYLLGRRTAALRRLRTLTARRALPGDVPRGQQTFVRRLDRKLRRFGYARAG